MTLASLSDTNASIEELRSKLASTHDVTTLRTTITELRQTVLTNSSHRESAMKRLASIEHSLDTLSAGAKKTNTMGGLVDSDNTQEAPTMPGQTQASENATGGAAGAPPPSAPEGKNSAGCSLPSVVPRWSGFVSMASACETDSDASWTAAATGGCTAERATKKEGAVLL